MSQDTASRVVVDNDDGEEPLSVRSSSIRTKLLLGSVPVLTLLAFLLGYPALMVLAVAPLGLVGLALLMVGRRPGGNLERSVEPSQLTRGETASALITSVNKRVTPTGVVEAVDLIAGQPVDVLIPPVPPRRDVTVSYSFVPLRRGELHMGPVTLERRDPWGLFVRRATASAELRVLVHPRVLPVEVTLAGNRIGREGGSADRDILGSNQFHTLREYVIGDELRQVHWRSSARVGKLMVKQLVDNPLPRALVILDTEIRSYNTSADFEQAVDAAASIGAAVVRAGLPVALRTTSAESAVEIVRVDDLPHFLDALALSNPREIKVAPAAIRQLLLATKSTSFFLVTGAGTGLLPTAIAALGLVGEGTVVRIGQEGGESRPRRGLVLRDALTCDDLVPASMRKLP